MTKTGIDDRSEFFTSQYEANKSLIKEQSTALLNRDRTEAMSRFRKSGLPGKKNENYKYTNIEQLFQDDIKLSLTPNSIKLELTEVFKCDVPDLETHVILLLNGFYHDRENPILHLDNGVIAGSLAEASRQYPDLVEKYYGQIANNQSEEMVALNSAFAQDGFFFYVPKGTVVEKPVQIINIGLWEEDLMIQQRNLFILEENSSSRIIICDHTLSPWKFITNAVSEIFAAKSASFEYINMQNENNSSSHISSNFIRQEASSHVAHNSISLHGGLIRNNVYVTLNGEGADNNSYGLYLADRNQHVDNFTFIDHAVPNCTSSQLYKGVLDDEATGAFNGRILVRKDAQQTRAYQSNNNILLTDKAKMNTKPQLEIYADDVKCSHGATVGQLDEDALFYMRSRGIGYKEARLLMMYAFVDEIISKIQVAPLHDRISDLVNRRLRGELTRCNNCQINCGNVEC